MKTNDNVLTKFINFIKKIFIKEQPKLISEKTEEILLKKEKNSFIEGLRINKEEDSELLKLQEQIENKEIDVSSLSSEQIDGLRALYKSQISELKSTLNNKKTELGMMKLKLKNRLSNA